MLWSAVANDSVPTLGLAPLAIPLHFTELELLARF